MCNLYVILQLKRDDNLVPPLIFLEKTERLSPQYNCAILKVYYLMILVVLLSAVVVSFREDGLVSS